jgi:2-polyprenyl-3-methyl-5-hydroxy-6-metoxy-1,4-benzoquinol methylase
MENLSSCPICNCKVFAPLFQAKDNTVSKDFFSIVSCNDCGFKFTNPRPTKTEIGPYYKSDEYISHSNANKGLINGLYQLVRGYALTSKIRLVKNLVGDGKMLLDIGCGTGAFLNTAKLAGYTVVGVEPDAGARQMAMQEYGLAIKEEADLTTLKENSFDVITMWHVLEHVHNLTERIQTLFRLIKTDGCVIIAVPNCESSDAKVYGANWAAYDVPRHLYHFTQKDIELLALTNGFSLLLVKQMWFDSFYVSMLSEKYKYGKLNIIRAMWNGALSNLKALGKDKNASSKIYVLKKAIS